MTLQQQKFIEEYLKDGNASRAAVAAGYGKKNPAAQGERLKKMPEIKAAIDKARAESEQAAAYSIDEAMREFQRIKELALADERPCYAAAVKAEENKCKIKGLFAAEKIDATLNGDAKTEHVITFAQIKQQGGKKKCVN